MMGLQLCSSRVGYIVPQSLVRCLFIGLVDVARSISKTLTMKGVARIPRQMRFSPTA